jgi:hypothetical protein
MPFRCHSAALEKNATRRKCKHHMYFRRINKKSLASARAPASVSPAVQKDAAGGEFEPACAPPAYTLP